MNHETFNRLQMAFSKATGMKRQKRRLFVDQLARRDTQMGAAMRDLLEHHDREQDPLEDMCDAQQQAAAAILTRDQPSVPGMAGYRVGQRIGVGGQADVYHAHQESTEQAVAIKIFRGCGLSDSQRRRVDAETEALVRLQLPNVVPILDRGITDCGREFLVTRFVEGRPIDQAAAELIASDLEAMLGLFAKVAETLGRVHGHGIIHRDLKPSNILVDGEGEPYLLDFGLASFLADHSGFLPTASLPRGFQGSILWASPEQVDSSFGQVGPSSDIYSLGVILYQALAGHFPYSVKGGIIEVTRQIIRTQPRRLRNLAGTAASAITPVIESVVLRAIEKRPERRFDSADELADALRVAINGVRSARTTVNRNWKTRLLWPLWGALAIALIVIAVLMTRTGSPPIGPAEPAAGQAAATNVHADQQPQAVTLQATAQTQSVEQEHAAEQQQDSKQEWTFQPAEQDQAVENNSSPNEVPPVEQGRPVEQDPSVDPDQPAASRPEDGPASEVSQLDDTLLPFGDVPPGWKQVGALQNYLHQIEKTELRIDRDFVMKLTLSADRRERAGFSLSLCGAGASSDLRIGGTKSNTWSDNESWHIQTPAGAVLKGLPLGSHTFTLTRKGERLTLTCDQVYRPDHNNSTIATFAISANTRYDAIRLATSGPGMRLQRIRLVPGK